MLTEVGFSVAAAAPPHVALKVSVTVLGLIVPAGNPLPVSVEEF